MVLRRTFLLMNEAASGLLEGMTKQDHNLIEATEEYHDNVTKFISYCLRLLNKFGHPDVRQTCYYYHIIASLDKIMDILKYNARDISTYEQKFAPVTIDLWKRINNSLREYYEFFYNFDLKKVDNLSRRRDAIKHDLKMESKRIPSEELLLLTSMKQILEILLDLTDFRMGLEY